MTTNIEQMPTRETPSLGHLLVGIIDRPAETFEALRTRQGIWTWGLPLLISFLAFTVLIVVQTPYSLELAQQQADQQLATLPPEQAEAARQTMEFTMSYPFILSMGLVSAIVVLLFIVLVQAAFFYFSSFIFGGDEIRFGAMFAMSAWARLPLAVAALVQTGLTLMLQRLIPYTGLGFLIATGDALADARNPLIALLSGVDLFWLWNLFLLVIGVAVMTRLSRLKSLALVAVYALLGLGMTVLPSLLFRGFGG